MRVIARLVLTPINGAMKLKQKINQEFEAGNHSMRAISLTSFGCREPLRTAGRQCDYFTMMREPVDRLVSAFFYCEYQRDTGNFGSMSL